MKPVMRSIRRSREIGCISYNFARERSASDQSGGDFKQTFVGLEKKMSNVKVDLPEVLEGILTSPWISLRSRKRYYPSWTISILIWIRRYVASPLARKCLTVTQSRKC